MPEMGFSERLSSDLAGTGLSVGRHPVSLFRQELDGRGVRRASELPGSRTATSCASRAP